MAYIPRIGSPNHSRQTSSAPAQRLAVPQRDASIEELHEFVSKLPLPEFQKNEVTENERLLRHFVTHWDRDRLRDRAAYASRLKALAATGRSGAGSQAGLEGCLAVGSPGVSEGRQDRLEIDFAQMVLPSRFFGMTE
jgi:hypothetical protein